jgi:hypothetical protein
MEANRHAEKHYLASQGCAHCTLFINFRDMQFWALARYEGSYDRQSVQSELEGVALIQIDQW